MIVKKKECCDVEQTVLSFYDQLKFYILKKVDGVEVAEDLVQEVMLRLVKAHRKSDKVENLRAWLFQIARNVIYEHYRDKERTDISSGENEYVIFGEMEISLMITDYIVPMIGLLPIEYGEPLKMSDIDGIPQKEVAKHLNITLSATKMRVQRGRIKLREMFAKCCKMEYDALGRIVSCVVKDHCAPLKQIEQDLTNKQKQVISSFQEKS